jgi:ATP-dependent helicase HepA
MEVGSFVVVKSSQSTEAGVVVGKIVRRTTSHLDVEVFRSPIGPTVERISVIHSEAETWTLPKQTPIYWRSERGWRFGRVTKGANDFGYYVQFPNDKEKLLVPTEDIFVRVPRDNDDPTDLLAAQLTNSPNFVVARNRLNRFVASQRAAYKGLTALATARIEFHRHQLGAVRRVLSDPIHRYLLADEVGLGKTIEAGILIAQHLIDEGEHALVLVIVPEPLVNQWKRELTLSFGLGLRGDTRVRIKAYRELDDPSFPQFVPTLVVMDEAHRCAAWAFPSGRLEDALSFTAAKSRYQKLEALSVCPKLLLLSGTPVLNHEDGFLAMLHLLDPSAYHLDDLDGFRRRIAARTVVADTLAELRPDFELGFLEPSLAALAESVKGDAELLNRIRVVEAALPGPESQAVTAIADLREYLHERYRLHHRIVRTHREDITVAGILPSRQGLAEIATGEDMIRLVADARLEEWRRRVTDDGFDREGPAANVFAHLVAALLSHPSRLCHAFRARVAVLRNATIRQLFDQEHKWLAEAAGDIERAIGEHPDQRLAALTSALKSPEYAKRRCVIISDSSDTADDIMDCLAATDLAPRLIRFRADDRTAVPQFERNNMAVLICDRSAEEGLNLQKHTARIIFYDMVFDVGRIEQRIGRFDRLQGMTKLHFSAFKPVGTYEDEWVRLLRDSVRIFNRSVARLQYLLADATEALRGDLLELGPVDAFQALTTRFAHNTSGLDANLKLLKRQELLDSTAWRDEELKEYSDNVTSARTDASRQTGPALEGWLTEVQFSLESGANGTRKFVHTEADQGDNTLIAHNAALDRWITTTQANRRAPTLKTLGPFSYDADEPNPRAPLLGLGHPVFDFFTRQMQADDRSKAWALWRQTPEVDGTQIFFRFDIVVEADLAPVSRLAEQWKSFQSLRRRVDEVFPVTFDSHWVDVDGSRVESAALLRILNRNYKAPGDRNLNAQRWVEANSKLDIGDWEARVRGIRGIHLQSILAGKDVVQRTKQASKRLKEFEDHTVRVLSSRAAHADASVKPALMAEIELEKKFTAALRAGVKTPALRIDNIGAVVLSRESIR